MALYTPITLIVTDVSTNAPIAGAKVYINGSANFDPTQFTVVTDASGRASFQILTSPTAVLMQVGADTYQSNSTPLLVNSTNPQTQQITLAPNPQQSASLTFQFTPAVAGIVWNLSSPVTATGVSTPDGTSSTSTAIPFGSYSMTASLSGYQTLVTTIVVNGQTSPYPLVLVKNNDPSTIQTGTTTSNSSQGTSQPASIVSQVSTAAPDQSEYIYPNSEYDKYFTISAARIYIGNLFIDELSSIQYTLQDNAIPVYGYASRYADAYAQGHSLVQGQLAINFVTEGYLYTVMKEYNRLLSSTQSTAFPINSPQANTVAQILGMMTTRDALIQQANNNPNNSTSGAQADKLQTAINALQQGLTSDQMKALSTLRNKQLNVIPDAVGFDNAVYQDVLFDIRIEMGNEVTGVKRVRYIEKCKLISNEQIIAPDGQSLMDSYGFIARRLR
jgi:hypothetical protein